MFETMIGHLLVTTLWLQLVSSAPDAGVDLTLQSGAMGADVVRGVLSKLDDLNTFDAAITPGERQVYNQFLRESAYVESTDGELYPLDNPDGGIWRISRDIFQQTRDYDYPGLFEDICRIFCVVWSNLQYSDLRIPMYSGLVTRVYLFHLYNTGQRLQETALDEDRGVFWSSHFGTNNLVSQWISRVDRLRNVEVCSVDLDVVFVIDSSGSIGPTHYQTVRDYTYNFTEGLLNGDTDSRVGLILYSTTATVEIPLDYLSFNEEESLLEEVSNLEYISQWTNTPEGLCLLKTMGWRESISVLRIALVLTDGRSNRFSMNCNTVSGEPGTVNSTAKEVHSLFPPVTVLAVGVANYISEELNVIATSVDLVDTLDSFDYRLLLQNQRSRTYFICFQESQRVTMGEIQNGAVSMGSVSRLQFSGPGNDGVTVRICIDQGVVVVYGSYTISNPSAALHDFSEVLRAAEGEVMASSCFITSATLEDVNGGGTDDEEVCALCENTLGRTKRQDDGEPMVIIYITIEGSSESESRFSVNSSVGMAFECAADSCGENAVLVRTRVSCFCQCAEGYEGDGQDCTNINECLEVPELCGDHQVCSDTVGSYNCSCETGYEREGEHCRKVSDTTVTDVDNAFQVDYDVYAIVIGVLCAAAMLVITVGLSIYLVFGKPRGKEQQNV